MREWAYLKIIIETSAIRNWRNGYLFLPPAQAETPEQEKQLQDVQKPGEVTQETGALSGKPAVGAASLQDAIKAFIKQRRVGFSELAFPSGFVFAATGSDTYEKHPNVISGRIA